MTSSETRRQFIEFFQSKGHAFVPSSPVVPVDDPTLMFTNAGMNQFKPIFLGAERAEHPRVANSQKCIRAGGKHNDLDDVGQDTYHHTFFEMLGNWSFGDYFKKEAIAWAWELLTKKWGIDKTRLHATYFGGLRAATVRERAESTTKRRSGEATRTEGTEARRHEGTNPPPPPLGKGGELLTPPLNKGGTEGGFELEPDNEARDLWTSVTDIDPSHIHPGNMKDNFWEMGDTGPCGPCSEIHIDLTPDKSGRDLVNKGDARVIEMWNLVFIQYNRGSDGKLTPLPAKHVDTGMGFERLCAVLQKKTSNYDTDLFTPIFEAIRKRTGAPKYTGLLPDPVAPVSNRWDTPEHRLETGATQPSSPPPPTKGRDLLTPPLTKGGQGGVFVDVSYRVIADHVRCLTFALTDGAIPSNEGRGYVLRRILRRAVRYGRQYLNMHEPFLCDLVPTVVEHMAGTFPELRTAHRGKNVEHVVNLIREEEESFLRTLDRGLRLANAVFASCLAAKKYSRLPTFNRTYIRALITKTFAEATDVQVVTFKRWDDLSPPEEGFDETLQMGRLATLITDDVLDAILAKPGVVPGSIAFMFHDTYGFPVDLTELMAEEQGLTIDVGEYERLMESARERARCVEDANEQSEYSLLEIVKSNTIPFTRFVGHRSLQTTVPSFFKVFVQRGAGYFPEEAAEGDNVAIAVVETPFYAERGGQVGDRGTIATEFGRVSVNNTILVGDVQFHLGTVESGILHDEDGTGVSLEVEPSSRLATMRNHTATHVLNWALREVLCPQEERTNPHVQQKGSLVDPEKTRFDFSHHHALSGEEISRIESLVKRQVADNLAVHDLLDGKREVPQKTAREINTLRAVFGEKYPDPVRVVSIGPQIKELLDNPKDPKWMQYSVEFCGGTHVANTKDIGDFVLIHEEAVAKGIRRVVGVTAERAKEACIWGDHFLAVADALRKGTTPPNPPLGKGRDSLTSVLDLGADSLAPPLTKGGTQGGSVQSRGREPADTALMRGTYDLSRFLRELSEATIPVLTRHKLADLIAKLQESAKEHSRKSAAQAQRGAVETVAELVESKSLNVNGVTVVVGEVPGGSADALRSGIDYVRNKKGSSAVLLAAVDDGKVTLVAGMSKDVVERGLKAGDLIKEICPLVGGRGGGRPDMAQGGGTDAPGLAKALARAEAWLQERL